MPPLRRGFLSPEAWPRRGMSGSVATEVATRAVPFSPRPAFRQRLRWRLAGRVPGPKRSKLRGRPFAEELRPVVPREARLSSACRALLQRDGDAPAGDVDVENGRG